MLRAITPIVVGALGVDLLSIVLEGKNAVELVSKMHPVSYLETVQEVHEFDRTGTAPSGSVDALGMIIFSGIACQPNGLPERTIYSAIEGPSLCGEARIGATYRASSNQFVVHGVERNT